MARWDQVIRISREIEERFNISAAVRSNGTLYLSGMTAINDAMEVVGPGDMEAQIQRIYDRLQAALAAAGLTLVDVVCETAYTTDIAALARSAHVRDRCYSLANAAPPAVTAVEVSRLFFPDALVELVATAELKN
ncbi:MAG: Rid family hydrolase [Gammaproteobacteria bacterium]|nr:Rid family hydrolase [Gammaproteobacteria bacterium]